MKFLLLILGFIEISFASHAGIPGSNFAKQPIRLPPEAMTTQRHVENPSLYTTPSSAGWRGENDYQKTEREKQAL